MKYLHIKRVLDVVGSLVGLLVLVPLIILVAALVLIFHGHPVFFTQERVTQGNRVFRLVKFRSMRPPDSDLERMNDERRLTAFGRFIRATSIDELPSLFNVLRGELSFIGPRPLTTDYLPLYSPDQMRRHEVKAGLSGLAQVSGRNALTWDEKFDLDLRYVDSVSFGMDAKIFVRTLATVLIGYGVRSPGTATSASFGGTLRSTSVALEQIASTRHLTQWIAKTHEGQRIGLCEIAALTASIRTIRLISDPSRPELDRKLQDELARETIRLLVNRARAADAELALCAVSAASTSASLYLDAGFRPLSQIPRAVRTGVAADIQFHDLLGVDLWPTESANLKEVLAA